MQTLTAESPIEALASEITHRQREVIDLSSISPQRTFIHSAPSKPDPKSSLYLDKTITKNADNSENHEIIGLHVVLQKGHENNLWEALTDTRTSLDPHKPQVKVKSLTIICDTLEIHGALKIPETNFTLFARKLVWADEQASINTSPLKWSVEKAQNASGNNPGENGAHGRHAGNLQLFVADTKADNKTRLIAKGGNGQHPGAGKDGKDGASRASRSMLDAYINIPYIFGTAHNQAHIELNPPAVSYTYLWKWSFLPSTAGKQSWGAGKFPTSGTNALAPGKPGNAGNGGTITTFNQNILNPKSFDNTAGKAGTQEKNYKGGVAGRPIKSAKYDVTIQEDLSSKTNAGYERKQIGKTHTTTSGKSHSSVPADVTKGKSIVDKLETQNLWLHPLQLQKVLAYSRALFLAGATKEVTDLLTPYEDALNEKMPNNDIWNNRASIHWTRSASEISTIQQRIRNHLDYYGNGAGFTPFLSLQSTINLFEQEAEKALHFLLLVKWINAKNRSAKELDAILTESIQQLNKSIVDASNQVVKAEIEVTKHQNELNNITQELDDLATKLSALELKLITQAENTETAKAWIKGGIKIASAICQVIPVGQPVLGTVGSLASVATDFIDADNDHAETVSKIGKVFDKAHHAAEKAEEARQKVKTFRDKFDDETEPTAKQEMLHKAGAGLGTAISEVSQAMSALQVSDKDVEAELLRLESESDEWQELTDKIRDVNTRKVATLTGLIQAIETVNKGYATISSASIGVMNFQDVKTGNLGKLNAEASACVNEMGQNAKDSLTYYLYLMVKAYETTVFKPLYINWNFSEVTDKINTLLETDDHFSIENFQKYADALLPIYINNIQKVRQQLLEDFQFNEASIPLQIGLDNRQTPELIHTINTESELTFNPLDFGLLLNDQHLARISNVELFTIDFDPTGPQLPNNTNVVISLIPDTEGTLRKSEKLYSVYGEKPINWKWSFIPSAEQQIRPSTPSKTSEDILNFILGKNAGDISQKVALPPVWSNLKLKVDYLPALPEDKKPKISDLYLIFHCDSSPAPDNQCVLDVRKLGTPAAVKTDCTSDLAARGNGLNNFYRIFTKDTAVTLNTDEFADGAAFQNWTLIGQRKVTPDETHTKVVFKIDQHIIAQSLWEPKHHQTGATAIHPEDLVLLAEHHPEESIRRLLKEKVALARHKDLIIRVKPEDNASTIGLIPSLDQALILAEEENNWVQINFRGIIGWVQKTI